MSAYTQINESTEKQIDKNKLENRLKAAGLLVNDKDLFHDFFIYVQRLEAQISELKKEIDEK